MKKRKYYGKNYSIQDRAKYMATDADGAIFSYNFLPHKNSRDTQWIGVNSNCISLKQTRPFNWRKSLRRV